MAADLVKVTGGTPKDSLKYKKMEKSTFVNKILYKSIGMLKTRIDFGHDHNSQPASDTFNPNLDFGDELEANGSYILEKVYCTQRNKRSLAFVDLTSSNIRKGSLMATITLGMSLHSYK